MNIVNQFLLRSLNKIPSLGSWTNTTKLRCTPSAICATQKLYSNSVAPASTPYEIVDPKSEEKLVKLVTDKINKIVADRKEGRLFAIVYLVGKQYKVTEGDVIVVEGYWPPDVGDKITLDKVMMAGGVDFTLVGRPVVTKGLVRVEATVIEKTLSHTKTNFKKKRRKQYMRIHFFRIPQTYLRINAVQMQGELNNPPEVTGLDTAVF